MDLSPNPVDTFDFNSDYACGGGFEIGMEEGGQVEEECP